MGTEDYTRGGKVREWLSPELKGLAGHNVNWGAENMEGLRSALAAYDNAVRSGTITERIGDLLRKNPITNAINPWKGGLSGNAGVGTSARNLVTAVENAINNAPLNHGVHDPNLRPSLAKAVEQMERAGGNIGNIIRDARAGNNAAAKRLADMISHAQAKSARTLHGRAGAGLALLLGLGALGYRYGK